jgi:hypothetical protein
MNDTDRFRAAVAGCRISPNKRLAAVGIGFLMTLLLAVWLYNAHYDFDRVYETSQNLFMLGYFFPFMFLGWYFAYMAVVYCLPRDMLVTLIWAAAGFLSCGLSDSPGHWVITGIMAAPFVVSVLSFLVHWWLARLRLYEVRLNPERNAHDLLDVRFRSTWSLCVVIAAGLFIDVGLGMPSPLVESIGWMLLGNACISTHMPDTEPNNLAGILRETEVTEDWQ